MKKNKLFKEEKFKVQTGINYNEENKLFKVQKMYGLLILHKWICSLTDIRGTSVTKLRFA